MKANVSGPLRDFSVPTVWTVSSKLLISNKSSGEANDTDYTPRPWQCAFRIIWWIYDLDSTDTWLYDVVQRKDEI